MENILFGLFLAFTVAYFIFALKKFEFAVTALPLFFPAYLWKTQVSGVPFTFIEALIYAVFLAFGIRGLADALKKAVKKDNSVRGSFKRGADFVRSVFHHERKGTDIGVGCDDGACRCGARNMIWPILLFIAAAVMGVIMTQEKIVMLDGGTIFLGRKVALGILKGWIIAPVIMFALFSAAVKKPGQILRMLNFYTGSALFLSIWGLFQVLTQSYATPDARASGPFESANYLALYIAPAVLYMAMRVKESVLPVIHLKKYSFWGIPFRRRKMPLEHPENFLFFITFLVLLLVLLFTKSYAAMLAVFAAAVFYFGLEYLEYYRGKEIKKFPWKMVALASLFSVMVLAAIFIIDQEKLAAIFQFNLRNSSSVRLQVYAIALQLLKENWLTGIGLGQFPALYQLEAVRVLGSVPYEWNMLHPHNLYLAMWLNMGLPGIAAFFWLIYLIICRSWASLKTFAFGKFGDLPKIRVAGIALMMIILIHGCLDTPFFKNDLALLFWLVVAVIVLPARLKDDR